MNRKFRRITASLVTLALLLSLLPAAAYAAPAAPKDGAYSIPFQYLKDNTSDRSIVNDYAVAGTGKLIVSGGSYQFQHEMNSISAFKHYSTRNDGAPKADLSGGEPNSASLAGYTPVGSAPVGGGTNADQAIVTLDITDIHVKQDVLIYIVVPAANYDHWYNVQLQLDVSSLTDEEENGPGEGVGTVTPQQFNEQVTVSEQLLANTEEGTGNGYYKSGSKETFQQAIDQAKVLAAGGNAELLKAAYIILLEGKKTYEAAKITVNKDNLVRAIADGEAFSATVRNLGSAAGTTGTHAVIADGEYPAGAELRVQQWLAAAQVVAEGAQSSQADVNTAIETLAANLEDLKKQQFKATELPLLVLDPDTGEISALADQFADSATVMSRSQAPYYQSYIQVAFAETQNSPELKVYGSSSNGSVGSNFIGGYVTEIAAGKSYQLSARHNSANDEVYQGFVKLQYTVGAETHTALFSLNANLLDALKANAAAARAVYTGSKEGNAEGEHSAASRAALLAAVEAAEAASAYLASTRPAINTASAALAKAVAKFESGAASQIEFSALHATNPALSSMNSYFLKPATVQSEGEDTYVSFKVKDSSKVVAFKVTIDGTLTDTTVVSTDEATDTRVVKFKVANLTAIIPAQVRVYMPDVIDPRTGKPYDATHAIRLAFNTADAASLKTSIAAAQKAHDAAVVGTGGGQYTQEAKTALQTAIAAVNTAAGNVLATQQQLQEAEAALQEALVTFYSAKVWSAGSYPIQLVSVAQTFADQVASGSVKVDGSSKLLRIAPKSGVTVKKLVLASTNEEIASSAKTADHTDFALADLSALYQIVLASGSGTAAVEQAYSVRLAAVTGEAEASTGGPGTGNPTNPEGLKDGKYTLNFTILKKGTSQASVMDEYVAHPGRLLVENGVKYVQINLKQSNEITGFTVEGSTPTTIESNASANTRRVQFAVDQLPAKLEGWVKIDWPAVNYHHEYDIEIQLKSYTPVSSWGSESFGPVKGRPNPGEEEEVKENEPGKETGGEPKPGTEPGQPAQSFSDTVSHWAKHAIDRAVKLGIVSGYPDGSFKPGATVKRSEWTAILGRALKLDGNKKELSFTDLSSIQPWARPFIEQALAAGIINGYADGSFQPNKEVTRAEAAIMIVRALKLPLEDESTLTFADKDDIPAFARAYVATAVKHGLITGLQDNRFSASKPASRADAVTLALRAVDYVEAKEKEKAKEKEAQKEQSQPEKQVSSES